MQTNTNTTIRQRRSLVNFATTHPSIELVRAERARDFAPVPREPHTTHAIGFRQEGEIVAYKGRLWRVERSRFGVMTLVEFFGWR